jgi:hypothetical protein
LIKKSSFLYSQSFLLIFIFLFLLHGIYLYEENILADVLSNSQVLIKHSMEEILSNACFRLHVEQPKYYLHDFKDFDNKRHYRFKVCLKTKNLGHPKVSIGKFDITKEKARDNVATSFVIFEC